jgi:TRAP-type uncharacterized transport system substrate-binding protein
VNDNKVTLLGALFFIFCAALIGGIFFLDSQLVQMQAEYDDLEQRRVDLTQTTKSLVEQKKVYMDAFAALESYRINIAPSDMGFYSEVQQVIQANGLNILSTRQLGVSREGRSSIAMTLKGDYYALMQVLANWRNTPTTVRVAALTVTAPRASDAREDVQADVTVEAIVAQAGASAGAR